MNTATQINDALEAKVDFCRKANDNTSPVVNTKDLDDIQVYQSITVHGMVLFGDNKAQPVPNKTDLIKAMSQSESKVDYHANSQSFLSTKQKTM